MDSDDADKYLAVGYEKVAEAIVKALDGHIVNNPVVETKPATEPINTVKIDNWIKRLQQEWIKRLQQECNSQGFRDKNGNKLSEDGILGEMTISAMPVIKRGTKGNITKLVQELLVSKGYNTGGVDGIAGSKTDSAIRNYQRARNISVDGCFGKDSLRVYNK